MKFGRPLSMSIRLALPSDASGSNRRARLEIRDEASSLQLVHIELDPEQFLALISSATVYVDADILPTLDRIGREMQHGSTSWGDAYQVKEPEAQARAEQWRADFGWETVELSKSHGTWRAIGRRWI